MGEAAWTEDGSPAEGVTFRFDGLPRCSRIFFTTPGKGMVAITRILVVHFGQRSASAGYVA